MDNVAGQAKDTAFKAWLCESSTSQISPWEWPGFTCLEDNTEDKNLIAYQLKLANKLRPNETEFNGIDATGKSWPVIGKLIEIISSNKVADVEVTNKLPASQISAATKDLWCAQKIASIAVKVQSVLKTDDTRWENLDILMGRHSNSEMREFSCFAGLAAACAYY